MGGQLLDFLVYLPTPTPVQVFGNYWHSQQLSERDRFNIIAIEYVVGQPVIIFWGDETKTVNDALNAVRSKLL